MNGDYIPRKTADFNMWAGVFVENLKNNRIRFNIPEPVFESLKKKYNNWVEKYTVSEAPSTRTSAAISEKRKARTELESEIRQINKEFVYYNRLVSNSDRENLGLHVRKTSRSLNPVPTTYPEFYTDTSIIRRLSVHFRDVGSKFKAKPFGVHGAEIRWGFSDTSIESVDSMTFSAYSTRSPYMIEFPDSKRGKTVYFCMRWQNTRGESGPYSHISSAVIP